VRKPTRTSGDTSRTTRGEVVRSGYGLCWRTGSWTPALAIAECDPDLMPAPKAAAPVPKPVAAVVPAYQPPKPAAQRVTLDADTLFDFDKAVLRPAGKTALDDFVAKTRDISPEVILAVGHADRFGSEPYNQKLSERRAATVKDYLLGQGRRRESRQDRRRGETQPKTKAGECTGAKSAKVIACLQPDRRVDVEIVGTRIVR
jgi:OOP family OmpA-OmpF porin